MAAREDLKMRLTRLRGQTARLGRTGLSGPAVLRTAEVGIHLMLAAVLAGAEVFGGFAPFGVAMVGASGTGLCGGAALLGVHLEGPCLSSEYKGAMPEHLLMHTADAELFAKYQKASGGHVRYTTLAPEIPGVPGLIPRLNAMGIVCAMGHSGAGYDQCAACVDAGVRSVTHLGNAMRLFHQHDPAIFGVALERDVYVEAICDGRHLHPGTVRLYLKAKGYDRVVAVTDSIMAAGLPDGSYKLGVNDVIVENGDAKLPNGVRAGSTLTMAQALRNLMAFTGEGAETVSRLMTANPARLMGWAGKGELDVGKDADLVLLDGDYQVARTVVGGRTVYTR